MNWNILGFSRRDWTEHGFKTLVDCKILERRREERRLAERRGTKHQFQAIKSCIADARNYRVARKVPALSVAHFD
jgi:DNA replication protein DnaD